MPQPTLHQTSRDRVWCQFVSPGALNHTHSSSTYKPSLQPVTQHIHATDCQDRICQSQHSLLPPSISCHIVLGVSDMNPLAVAAGQCVYKRNRRAVEGRGCTFDLPYRVYLTGCEGQKKACDTGNESGGT